jgi:hypothetical protein
MTRFPRIELLFSASAAILSACAPTFLTLGEMRALPAKDELSVAARSDCLFDRGMDFIASRAWLWEPRFTAHMETDGARAWFRQPLTLIEIERVSTHESIVRRTQTEGTPEYHGRSLLIYLSGNPCGAQRAQSK